MLQMAATVGIPGTLSEKFKLKSSLGETMHFLNWTISLWFSLFLLILSNIISPLTVAEITYIR